MKRLIYIMALTSVCLALFGCGSTDIRQRQHEINAALNPKTDASHVDPIYNAKIAASDLRDTLLYKYGSLENTELNKYLNTLLKKSLSASNIDTRCCKVVLLNDPSLSAFAMKSGTIFVSAGWLIQAETEGELVGVLAHEAGHVILHDFDSDSVAEGFTNISVLFQILSGENASLNWSMLDEVSTTYVHPTWNREQENNADAFAVKVSIKAGYSFSESVGTVLDRLVHYEKLTKSRSNDEFHKYFESLRKRHDDASDRATSAIAYFKAEGKPFPQKPASDEYFILIQNSSEYQQLKSRYSLSKSLSIVNKKMSVNHLIALQNKAIRENDLYSLINICRYLQSYNSKLECYRQSIRLDMGSWYPYLEIAQSYKMHSDRKNAISSIALGYANLGKPAVLLPDIVGFYDNFDKSIMNDYLKICFAEGLGVFKKCSERADVERKKIEGDKNAKKLVDKIFK